MSASRTFPRRYLSLWLPYLPTDRVRRQHDAGTRFDPEAPLVLVSKTEGTQRITAADPLACRSGLAVGMALAEARAMVPGVTVLSHDAAADAHLLDCLADWADRYTPLVGRDPPAGLILDITGAAHLQGGEANLRDDLMARLGRQWLKAAVAIAPTVGAAWAFARCCGQDGTDASILPDDIDRAGLDAALAPLPIKALRLAPETTAALRRVGLKRIGDLIGRPRTALAARFGASLVMRLDQARGIDTEPISPRQPIPPAIVEQSFAEPILTTSAVEQCCRTLTQRLEEMLETRGQGANALELSVYRVDGLVKRISLRLASPTRHAKTLANLLALRLDHLDDPLDPGFGYDLVRLAAISVAAKSEAASPLAGFDDQSSPIRLAEACATLIDRLTARFGEDRIRSLSAIDTHIPEAASRLVPASIAAEKSRPMTPATLSQRRPLRMLDPPEPVDVMAEVPDGPPLQMRWRRRPLRIVRADGPERIAPEWWRPDDLTRLRLDAARIHDVTRDYWSIEDATGRRLWLYREGFYGQSGNAIGKARWFVHGLFA